MNSYNLVTQTPRDPELAIFDQEVGKKQKIKYGAFFIKTCLTVSIIGNIVLTTTLVTNHNVTQIDTQNFTQIDTQNFTQIEQQRFVNLSDFPFIQKCHLESNSGYVKDHVFAHICYNSWLHSSIIDLRFEKDGNVTLELLRKYNFTNDVFSIK